MTLLMPLPQHSLAEIPPEETLQTLNSGLKELQAEVQHLQSRPELQTRDGRSRLADVAICAKAVEWMLRHNEFPKKEYAAQGQRVLEIGRKRAGELKAGAAPWEQQTGVTIRGYFSKVDGSVQPYALTLPEGVNPLSGTRWPLYVHLHGRANDMNEVNFISRHEGRKLPEGQTWIQLDVYGRGNNAYRWAGETDVFEAIADVKRRFRIDDNRITLHGFSMGGAGSWHLGLHYPSQWCSVGPGAGFVDFYKYQNQQEQLPKWQHETLGIYDAIDYSLNAANVPVCTYGGENDAQLVASTSVVDTAKNLGVDIKLLIGPGMGHKFHPDSLKEFMAFHAEKSREGRQKMLGRPQVRFTTRYLKYNSCDWVTIDEVDQVYQPSTVEAKLAADGSAEIQTSNISVLSIARDVANQVVIDGDELPCYEAAEGLLPHVFYEKAVDGWHVLNYDDSRSFQDNPEINKRRGLQGPIDDAFTDSFICVLGTKTSSCGALHDSWVQRTYSRFASEFDKWMRATVPTIHDSEVTEDIIRDNNLILFGDFTSNAVLQKVLPDLPITTWTADTLTVAGKTYNAKEHGLCMIFPNPLNPRRYVVINSGHTFHEQDFRASNAWLFPRMGDIAVVKFQKGDDAFLTDEIVWAANFNSNWKLAP
ncbi:MAG: prolyl oligopeptidase family serine peptidase [Planctomycetaceae bacterium]|nr:prolyl oligopeptidase family serine peptidase [Planctomycetaceae bacterium]